MIAKSVFKSDIIGAAASGLCIIHCLATPFIFAVQSYTINQCHDAGPAWWGFLDFLFIAISLFAIYQSSKHSNKLWLKYGLIWTWVILSLLLLNERIAIFELSTWYKHFTAGVIIVLHIYNLKYGHSPKQT